MSTKRILRVAAGLALVAIVGWTYHRSLVPAIHPDHDHGLENLAGGGFLVVEPLEGGRRNLVGRPGRVLVLHWFELGSPSAPAELPGLVEYASSVAGDPGIEVVMVATNRARAAVKSWAEDHGVPARLLHVDPEGKTAMLIGVRRIPETLIYDAEGHLVHQARGPLDWTALQTRAAIAGFKDGGAEHQH